MSEELVSGCIQHKDNRHLRLYNDYMDIYKGNEHKAKIIRILETWTDSKRAEWFKDNLDRLEQGQKLEAPDFWITMSYGQFKQFMYGSISEDTLKKYLTELEKSKHITRRVNPDFPYGSPQYLLNTKAVQNALNKRAMPPLVPELPQFDTPPSNFLPPQEITPTQGVELPLPRGENTYQPGGNFTPTQGGKSVPSNNSTKNYLESGNNTTKEVASQNFDATPLAPSDFLPDEQLAASYADEQGREMHALAAAYEDEDDRPTQKTPAVKLNGATNEHHNHPDSHSFRSVGSHPSDALFNTQSPTGHPVGATQAEQQTPVAIANTLDGAVAPPTAAVRQSYTPSVSDGATTESGGESRPLDSSHSAVSEQASQAILQQQAASRQAQNGAGTRQRKGKKVTQAELKTPEEEAFDARCTALQKRINAWRGYSLEKQGAIINERRCIRKLVEKFTDEQHDLIHQYLFTRHWRYSKPDNRYTIGGYVLLEEGDNVLQILKDEKQKPAPLADKKPVDIYTAASLDPERNKRNLERLKQRTAARLAAEGGVN